MSEGLAILLNWGLALLCAFGAVLASQRYLHMLQLESYQGKMYLKWVLRRGLSECIPCMVCAIGAMAIKYPSGGELLVGVVLDVAFTAYCVVKFLRERKLPAKKPLVYTSRIKRLNIVMSVLFVIVAWGGFVGFPMQPDLAVKGILRYVPGMLPPMTMFVAYLIAYPMEELIKKKFFNEAKKKLASRENVKRVAITGSFGKTSTKYILGAMLSEHYNTLITPGSFNTPMGVTRIIREQLEDSHEVFVAEMGARYVGDIKELCTLVNPQYGMITAVGKQHIETFGSYENVIKTKGELFDALTDGCAFANGDQADCVKLLEACGAKEKYLFGIHGENLYMRAGEISVSRGGSSFTLYTWSGESVACSTKLLGEHNIVNITGAAACAYKLGVSLDEIARAIAKVEPIEHRLQLIPGNVTVIDDAFNSNPVGAKAALDVLAQFDGRRIVVTPGMVELGDEEEEIHKEFGKQMARCADVVILIGEARTDSIRRGLIAGGFDENSLVIVESLKQASAKLPLYTTPGCVVLFENDLPDNYDE